MSESGLYHLGMDFEFGTLLFGFHLEHLITYSSVKICGLHAHTKKEVTDGILVPKGVDFSP